MLGSIQKWCDLGQGCGGSEETRWLFTWRETEQRNWQCQGQSQGGGAWQLTISWKRKLQGLALTLGSVPYPKGLAVLAFPKQVLQMRSETFFSPCLVVIPCQHWNSLLTQTEETPFASANSSVHNQLLSVTIEGIPKAKGLHQSKTSFHQLSKTEKPSISVLDEVTFFHLSHVPKFCYFPHCHPPPSTPPPSAPCLWMPFPISAQTSVLPSWGFPHPTPSPFSYAQ